MPAQLTKQREIPSRILENAKSMIAELKEVHASFSDYGISKVWKGDPAYLEMSDLPSIALFIDSIKTENRGIGRNTHSPRTTTIGIKVFYSGFSDNFDYEKYINSTYTIYDYFINNLGDLRKGVGPSFMVEVDECTFGFDKKVVDQKIQYLNTSRFSIQLKASARSTNR